MKKSGLRIDEEKYNLWQCCGHYLSPGIVECPVCGKPRSDHRSAGTPDPKPERRKRNALDRENAFKATILGMAGRFRVTIERHSPRSLDDDNFAGGCKQLRDVIAELLEKKGDSVTDGVEFRYIQVKSAIKKTVIKIQQIKE